MQKKLPKNFDQVWRCKHCGGICEVGTMLQHQCAAVKSGAQPPQADNTGSPKFPLDIAELRRYRAMYEIAERDYDHCVGASSFIDFIERQLRASA